MDKESLVGIIIVIGIFLLYIAYVVISDVKAEESEEHQIIDENSDVDWQYDNLPEEEMEESEDIPTKTIIKNGEVVRVRDVRQEMINNGTLIIEEPKKPEGEAYITEHIKSIIDTATEKSKSNNAIEQMLDSK